MSTESKSELVDSPRYDASGSSACADQVNEKSRMTRSQAAKSRVADAASPAAEPLCFPSLEFRTEEDVIFNYLTPFISEMKNDNVKINIVKVLCSGDPRSVIEWFLEWVIGVDRLARRRPKPNRTHKGRKKSTGQKPNQSNDNKTSNVNKNIGKTSGKKRYNQRAHELRT